MKDHRERDGDKRVTENEKGQNMEYVKDVIVKPVIRNIVDANKTSENIVQKNTREDIAQMFINARIYFLKCGIAIQ